MPRSASRPEAAPGPKPQADEYEAAKSREASERRLKSFPAQHAAGTEAIRGRRVAPRPLEETAASLGVHSLQTDLVVRIAVIDDADRMVYNDVRDRRGWQQPLSASQAASEVRIRHMTADGKPATEPRMVKTIEMADASVIADARSVKRAPDSTPYSVGKSHASRITSPSAVPNVKGAEAVKAKPLAQPAIRTEGDRVR